MSIEFVISTLSTYISTMGHLILTVAHFCCHYRMMMRWYRENPKDGNVAARSISVGIPPE